MILSLPLHSNEINTHYHDEHSSSCSNTVAFVFQLLPPKNATTMTLPLGNCHFQNVSVSCHCCPQHPPSTTAHTTTTVTNSNKIMAWNYHAVTYQNTCLYCPMHSCHINRSFGHHSWIIIVGTSAILGSFPHVHQPLHPS